MESIIEKRILEKCNLKPPFYYIKIKDPIVFDSLWEYRRTAIISNRHQSVGAYLVLYNEPKFIVTMVTDCYYIPEFSIYLISFHHIVRNYV